MTTTTTPEVLPGTNIPPVQENAPATGTPRRWGGFVLTETTETTAEWEARLAAERAAERAREREAARNAPRKSLFQKIIDTGGSSIKGAGAGLLLKKVMGRSDAECVRTARSWAIVFGVVTGVLEGLDYIFRPKNP